MSHGFAHRAAAIRGRPHLAPAATLIDVNTAIRRQDTVHDHGGDPRVNHLIAADILFRMQGALGGKTKKQKNNDCNGPHGALLVSWKCHATTATCVPQVGVCDGYFVPISVGRRVRVLPVLPLCCR